MLKWSTFLSEEKQKQYFLQIKEHINTKRQQGVGIFPEDKFIFYAFKCVELEDVKVVILGQDPYHGEYNGMAQAHGLSFSVRQGMIPPPSLKNIYKELSSDIVDFKIPNHGCLVSWAHQGVLLLNSVLTVEAGKAKSHQHLGWEQFTNRVINVINSEKQHVVFLMWGSNAQKKTSMIDQSKHLVLKAPHPSPLSAYRGFFGCQHFSKANQYLSRHQKQTVNWHLPLTL